MTNVPAGCRRIFGQDTGKNKPKMFSHSKAAKTFKSMRELDKKTIQELIVLGVQILATVLAIVEKLIK
jgi:hypothetical protein